MKVKVKKHDITGVIFGDLTVIKLAKRNAKSRGLSWQVICVCGNKKVLSTASIKRGVQHCGCKTEVHREIKHGMYGTKEYNAWSGMKQRCEDENCPAYKDYGARGITVFLPWSSSFIEFYRDVGPAPSKAHTLDRIDNNKGYEPGNVRWVSMKVQNNNRRSNTKVKYGDETLTVSEWSTKLNINYSTLYDRIYKHKWPLEKAFEQYGRK